MRNNTTATTGEVGGCFIIAVYAYFIIAWIVNTIFFLSSIFSDESTAKQVIVYAIGTFSGVLAGFTVWY